MRGSGASPAMAPTISSFRREWWRPDQKTVVVKMENPNNWSMVEVRGRELEGEKEEGHAQRGLRNKEEERKGKNAKQMTWVFLLLRAHQAAGFVAWLGHGFWALNSRLLLLLLPRRSGQDRAARKSKLSTFLRFFVAFSLLLLLFEIAVRSTGMHFHRPQLLRSSSSSSGTLQGLLQSIYLSWIGFRARYLAPPLQSLANACIVLFLIQSADRLIQCLGCVWIRFKKLRPIAPLPSFHSQDPEQSCSAHPMVLVQIPMCNEREVYQQSIGAVAQLDWPKDRLLIQVLDDSDDPETQMLIRSEVQKWNQKGVNIVYRHRAVRTGYKAGNLKSAMTCDYVKDYEFVAIFDADFQPQPDFLNRTVIYFQGNDDVGLVQARWSFINKDENLLTRLQYINLSYHFEVEQQVNGIFLNFFGFNGTAGVWRIKALEESGGWMERTTVEDMDIAVRAHLNGWKFIFLNDVKCLCEVPESYAAYRKQQHRWHSGPMQLFRLCLPDIIRARISIMKKANLIFLFFLLRKLILPFYSFTLFCIILPMTMFIPEAQLPTWVVCYVPAVMSLVNIVPAPKSFPFVVPYLLFENTMSVTKFNAMVSGLFQLGSTYEWVVTKKVGRASESDLIAFAEREAHAGQEMGLLYRGVSESGLDELSRQNKQIPKSRKKMVNRVYKKELALAFLLLTASVRSLLSVQGVHFYFLLFQGISFLVVGLDLIGERVS